MAEDLPNPIRRALDAGVDEAGLQRVWSSVRARREARKPARSIRWRPLVIAAATAVAATVIAAWPSDEGARPGPLTLLGGREPGVFGEGRAELSDGSTIDVSPGARISTLESSDGAFMLLLGSGRARFEVTPGGPRRWTIECGLVTVEVVGTIFTIARERDPESVVVEVERGAVLVRGELVHDRVQRLGAGDRLEVRAPIALVADAREPTPETGAPEEEDSEADAIDAPVRAPAWRELAERSAYREAYESLGDEGFRREVARAGVNELFALADVARLGGHPNDAIPPLERIVTEHSSDSRAALAAFTLGRIHLDNRGDARRAIELFDRALALGLPDDLAEAALARLAQARARIGDHDGARAAARTYLERYPRGAHRVALLPLAGVDETAREAPPTEAPPNETIPNEAGLGQASPE
jgi:transmembrane sensor